MRCEVPKRLSAERLGCPQHIQYLENSCPGALDLGLFGFLEVKLIVEGIVEQEEVLTTF